MDRNAAIVQDVQEKIDRIVAEGPRLLDRLDVVMASTALFSLLADQQPILPIFRALRVNMPCPLSPPIQGTIVTNRAVEIKQRELKAITEELILLFERVNNVLDWNAVIDICSARQRIVILPQGHNEALRILDVYIDHCEAEFEAARREEVLQELDSSTSSIDSYSR